MDANFDPMNVIHVLLFYDGLAHDHREWRFQVEQDERQRRRENQRISRLMDSMRSKKLQKASEKQVIYSSPRFIRAVGSNFPRM
jgi:hypothetical protein